MNKLMNDNIKEFYKRNYKNIDNLIDYVYMELKNLIKKEDKNLTLTDFEIEKTVKKLIIKLIKKL